MTTFHLTDLEKGVCKKVILKQINDTIEKLHTVRNKLRNDVIEFSDDQMLVLVLFLIYFDKSF